MESRLVLPWVRNGILPMSTSVAEVVLSQKLLLVCLFDISVVRVKKALNELEIVLGEGNSWCSEVNMGVLSDLPERHSYWKLLGSNSASFWMVPSAAPRQSCGIPLLCLGGMASLLLSAVSWGSTVQGISGICAWPASSALECRSATSE